MLLANEVHATRAFICVQPALGNSIAARAGINATDKHFETSIIGIPGHFKPWMTAPYHRTLVAVHGILYLILPNRPS